MNMDFDKCPECGGDCSHIEQVRILYGKDDYRTFQKLDVTAKGFSQVPYKVELPYRLDGMTVIIMFRCAAGHVFEQEIRGSLGESEDVDNLSTVVPINKPFSFQPVNGLVCLPLEFAILHLGQIKDGDPNKDAALLHMIKWCQSSLANKHQFIVEGKTTGKMGRTDAADAAASRIQWQKRLNDAHMQG